MNLFLLKQMYKSLFLDYGRAGSDQQAQQPSHLAEGLNLL